MNRISKSNDNNYKDNGDDDVNNDYNDNREHSNLLAWNLSI